MQFYKIVVILQSWICFVLRILFSIHHSSVIIIIKFNFPCVPCVPCVPWAFFSVQNVFFRLPPCSVCVNLCNLWTNNEKTKGFVVIRVIPGLVFDHKPGNKGQIISFKKNWNLPTAYSVFIVLWKTKTKK